MQAVRGGKGVAPGQADTVMLQPRYSDEQFVGFVDATEYSRAAPFDAGLERFQISMAMFSTVGTMRSKGRLRGSGAGDRRR